MHSPTDLYGMSASDMKLVEEAWLMLREGSPIVVANIESLSEPDRPWVIARLYLVAVMLATRDDRSAIMYKLLECV